MTPKNPLHQIHEELWNFPCEHSIKVMGYSEYPLIEIICSILSGESIQHYPDSIQVKESRKGKYSSITVKTVFTQKQDVETLYTKLADRKEIVWAL